jgi:hypothetical protein
LYQTHLDKSHGRDVVLGVLEDGTYYPRVEGAMVVLDQQYLTHSSLVTFNLEFERGRREGSESLYDACNDDELPTKEKVAKLIRVFVISLRFVRPVNS